MALAKCHECGQDVSTQARACPGCGAPVKKPSGARLGLFLLAVLGVFGLLALATRDRTPSERPPDPPAHAPAPTSPAPPAPDLLTPTTTEPRRYQASFMDVPLKSAPRPDAKKIGNIPRGTVVEAIETQDFWVKVKVKNTVGWAASTAMERLMDHPAPDVEFVHSGYKVIGNIYRYFFGIRNSGLASYTDPVMLSLYNKDKVISTHTYTFTSDPIRASGGRSFYVDTDIKATRFEFATKQGKSGGPIGKLIERM
jgi:hypothetical protein